MVELKLPRLRLVISPGIQEGPVELVWARWVWRTWSQTPCPSDFLRWGFRPIFSRSKLFDPLLYPPCEAFTAAF